MKGERREMRAKEHVHDHFENQVDKGKSSSLGHQGHHDHEEDDDHGASEYGRKITMIGVAVGFFSLVLLEHWMLSVGVEHSHGPPEKPATINVSQIDLSDDDDLDSNGGAAGHSHSHSHQHHVPSSPVTKRDAATGLSDSFSLTAFVAIAVHSLVDGIVIGGSFRVSAAIGARVAIAIVLHKVPDGFVVASLLAASNRSRKWVWVAVLSSVTPMGAMLGYGSLTGIPSTVLGAVLGFAAGTFLFISVCGIIPELLHSGNPSESRIPIFAVLIGYILILFVNSTLHAH